MSEDNRKFDKYVGEINDLLVSYVNKETAYDVCSVYLIDDYDAYLSIIEKVKEIESKYSFARKISFIEVPSKTFAKINATNFPSFKLIKSKKCSALLLNSYVNENPNLAEIFTMENVSSGKIKLYEKVFQDCLYLSYKDYATKETVIIKRNIGIGTVIFSNNHFATERKATMMRIDRKENQPNVIKYRDWYLLEMDDDIQQLVNMVEC